MKKRLLTLIFVLFGAVVFAQIIPKVINFQDIERESTGSILVYESLTIQFSMNSSSAVQFGTLVCVNSDNNSLLIHLNIK